MTLVNADTDTDIGLLHAGDTLNLATLPTKNLNVRADVQGTVASVRFSLDGAVVRTENVAPYALGGDTNGNYAAWTPSVGSHSLTAAPFIGTGATGTAGIAMTLSFSVVNQAAPPPAPTPTPIPIPAGPAVSRFVLVNADTDRDIQQLSPGVTLTLASLATRNLNVRAEVTGTVASVVFTLDGKIVRTENVAPYALGGDTAGNYYAWTPSAGNHTLVARPYTGTNGTGTAGTALMISFTVV
jgi:hypothetical protein